MIDVVPLFPERGELVAHFARRTGGVSAAPFASLNLGFSTGDDPSLVVENRRRLAAELGAPLERWVVPGQAHGSLVAVVTRASAGEGAQATSKRFPDRDAVFLPEPGVFSLMLSADCPLVAVIDSRRRWAGLAHAGWRGAAAGVVDALVETFVEAGSDPAALAASVSPAIGGERYPVGPEVFEALCSRPGFDEACVGADGIDLRTLHRATLSEYGIPADSISVSSECSHSQRDHYFSHRRDRGRTGRNGALIGWRKKRA